MAGVERETGIPVYKWDVADADACIEGVEKAVRQIGPIDVLVNNAGLTRDRTMKKMTTHEWNTVVNTDLGGCFHMSRAVINSMEERKFGRIINTASIAGKVGFPALSHYSATKFGVIGFSNAVAAAYTAVYTPGCRCPSRQAPSRRPHNEGGAP